MAKLEATADPVQRLASNEDEVAGLDGGGGAGW
jgi:hypothetical protein